MNDYQKLSADLSRVAEFLVAGNEQMASKFSDRVVKLYKDLPGKIGKYELGDYLMQIKEMKDGKDRAIERAYTAADILLRRKNG